MASVPTLYAVTASLRIGVGIPREAASSRERVPSSARRTKQSLPPERSAVIFTQENLRGNPCAAPGQRPPQPRFSYLIRAERARTIGPTLRAGTGKMTAGGSSGFHCRTRSGARFADAARRVCVKRSYCPLYNRRVWPAQKEWKFKKLALMQIADIICRNFITEKSSSLPEQRLPYEVSQCCGIRGTI